MPDVPARLWAGSWDRHSANPSTWPHWQQNNIFLLARKNRLALRNLAIYFNCGQQDDFGFEDGAAALHRQLRAEGIKHEYHSYPGDHSLTYFLSHMGEIMEFHSRVFAQPESALRLWFCVLCGVSLCTLRFKIFGATWRGEKPLPQRDAKKGREGRKKNERRATS